MLIILQMHKLLHMQSQNKNTVKLHYNGLGYNRYSVNTDFLVPVESLLIISMCDNTVRTDSVSTKFRLLQTSFLVPTLWTRWNNGLTSRPQLACLFNRDSCLADRCIVRTAVFMSWLRNHAGHQPAQPSARPWRQFNCLTDSIGFHVVVLFVSPAISCL